MKILNDMVPQVLTKQGPEAGLATYAPATYVTYVRLRATATLQANQVIKLSRSILGLPVSTSDELDRSVLLRHLRKTIDRHKLCL